MGTTGDLYNIVLVETIKRLYKSEVIKYLKQSWNSVNDVELATFEWAVLRAQISSCKAKSIINQFLMFFRFHKTHLHSTIDYVSTFELEKRYYDNSTLSGISA